MEAENRVPLIRASTEFGYLTKSRLSDDPKRLDSPKLPIDLQLLANFEERPSRITSPTAKFLNTTLHTTEDIIKQLSQRIQEIFPKVINSPYNFADVKILASETHALAVTNEGFVVFVDISNNTFEESQLSKRALSSVLICQKDTLAFIKERDQGKIYCILLPSLAIKKTLKIMGEAKNGIGRMCLAPEENYLYARLWKGDVIRWDIEKLGNYEVLLSDKNILCMNIAPDGIVVAGTLDRRLVLYSLDFEKITEKTVDFIVDAYINFSESGHLIILGMAKNIKVFDKDTLGLVYEFNIGCQANECKMTMDNKYLIAVLDSGHLAFYSVEYQGKEFKIKMHDAGIKSMHVTANQDQIFTFGSDCRLSHIKFPKLSLFIASDDSDIRVNTPYWVKESNEMEVESSINFGDKNHEGELFKPTCVVQTQDCEYLIAGGESNKIFIFDSSTKSKEFELIGHHDYILSLAILNENHLASGSADHSIMIWNIKEKYSLQTFHGHIGHVTALARIDTTRLASGSQDKSIKIWAWREGILLNTISDLLDPILSLAVPKSNKLLVGMKKLIQCWNLQNYSLIFEKKSYTDIKCLRYAECGYNELKKTYYALGNEKNDNWIENPFTCIDTTYWGPDEGKTYDLLTYIRDMMMGKIPPYDGEMDLWLITPYNMNILHFYAFFNIPEYLGQSIANGTSLINSVIGSNPLTIALEKKYKECVEIIIKSAWKRYAYNPFIFGGLDVGTIEDLNHMDTYLLPKVYKLIMCKAYLMPKYCSSKAILPKAKLSFSQILLPKNLLSQENLEGNEIEIRFLHSIVPLYLNPGSKNSIDFLSGLINCKQTEIFSTELIQTILGFKWNQVKKFLYFEWVLFILYFLALVYVSLTENQDKMRYISQHAMVVIGSFIFLFNIYYSLLSCSFTYWAYTDLARTIFMILYFAFLLMEDSELNAYLSTTLIITVFISFFEGVYFFKLFKGTRHIVRISIELVKESLSLLFLIFYILFAVAVIVCIKAGYQINPESKVLIEIIRFNDQEDIQNMYTVFMEYVGPAIIFVALLAVCGHNYEQSFEVSNVEDYKEISKLVLRGEYLMPWKRHSNWLQYIQICTHDKFVGTDRVKKLAKAVKQVKQEQEQNHFEFLEGFAQIREKIESMHLNIKELKREKRSIRKK
ncbi:hypothetical protein SteCoe_6092 [Stentor coeruleus]|uniref:Uncharacterized protein n=1 Tax=Stentor coeruleus TaxID=5963 RepID=A0A1R2CQY6_9CILI|nr:hypothetical protein SteCoe_6092 [Stentor coeruleus]